MRVKSDYLKLDIQLFADGEISYKVSIDGKEANKSIDDISKKTDSLSKKFSSAGKTLSVGLTAPLTAFGAYAVKTATDFDKASNQMKASLGLTAQEAEEYNQVMKNIYNANYGESFEDVANAISIAQQELYEFTPDQIEEVTESAFALRDVFGIEITDSIRATKALITNFGTTSEEAMNLLTLGFQNGLNYSDEFIDNINEYSVQFNKLGLSAEDMFNIFQSGSDAGAWNLDKIGDAVKEFSIRAIDGSQTTADGFKALGMDADIMAQKFASGGDTARSAFYEVIKALGEMDDPVAQSIAGVNLFGTMWEDLGPQVVTQLGSIQGMYDKTVDSMETMKDVKYDDLGSMLEGLKRSVSGVALEIGNALMPTIQSIIGKISGLVNWFSNLSENGKKVVLTIAGIAMAIGPVITAIGALIETGKKIKTIVTLIKSWNVVTKLMTVAQGALNAVMNMNPISLIVIAIVALIAIIVVLWNKCEWFREGVMTVINAIWGAIQSVGTFIMGVFQNVFNFVSGIFTNLWNVIQTVVNTIVSIFSTAWNTIKSVATTVWNGILGLFSAGGKIFTGVVEGIAGVFKTIVNAIIKGINKIIRIPFDTINGILNFIRNIDILGVAPFKGLWKQNPLPVPQIPTLNVGTNYIAREGLAYLHEGEAVVPKKYNPAIGGNLNQSYNYSNDNSETNALLFDLNKGVNALLEKDTNLYVNGKQFAQATFKDFKNEGQRLGASSAVNVR